MYLVEIHPVNSNDIYDLFHINIVKYNTFLFSMRGMSSGTLNIKCYQKYHKELSVSFCFKMPT